MKNLLLLIILFTGKEGLTQQSANFRVTEIINSDIPSSSDKPIKVNYRVHMEPKTISINDNSNHVFVVQKTLTQVDNKEQKTTAFQCVDKSLTPCRIMISYYKTKLVRGTNYMLMVVYNNTPVKMIIYRLKRIQ